MSFVERLRQLIEDKGVSRTTVAKATGISEGTFTKWFGKADEGMVIKPREDNLERLSKYFEVSIDWLRTGKGTKYDSITQVNEEQGSYHKHSTIERLTLQNERLLALIEKNTSIILNLTIQ